MSITAADVLRELRDTLEDMAEDAHLTAEDYTGDAVPGDDASQAEAWGQWTACIRRFHVAHALREQVQAAIDGRTAPTLSAIAAIDFDAAAADAQQHAHAAIMSRIADAREYSPDSWTAHKADPNA